MSTMVLGFRASGLGFRAFSMLKRGSFEGCATDVEWFQKEIGGC